MKKIITIAVIALLLFGLNRIHAAPAAEAANAKTIASTEVHDKKGKLLYSVKRYSENQLSRTIKSLVHSQYAEYDIIGVEEIIIPGTAESIYMVHLQDETHIKVIRVYNGETEVTASYKRG